MKNKYNFPLYFVCLYCIMFCQHVTGQTVMHNESSKEPTRSDSTTYTWILLPDPQTYTKFGRNQSLFSNMIDWIIDQQQDLNIKMVFCTGDLVEQNNILTPDSINGDQTSHEQWEFISKAFYKLNNRLPYILCTGCMSSN